MLHLMLHAAPLASASALSAANLTEPLPVSFEQAMATMEAWPQMFCEPDGWFDWTSPPGEPAWQIAGQLHDRGARLGHVEVKLAGVVPQARFDQFLSAFGWPKSPLVFQVVREAVLLDEATFRASCGEVLRT